MPTTSALRTTVALPAELLEAMDGAVRAGKARSRNHLIAAAVPREAAAQQRAAIDAAFAMMAHDPDYQAEAPEVATEFAQGPVGAPKEPDRDGLA